MLAFVVFYVEITPETENVIASLAPAYKIPDFQFQARAMFHSAERIYPGCRKIILTDLTTNIAAISEDVEIYRYPLDSHLLTLSRTTAQWLYLKEAKHKYDLVYVDSDILIQKNLDPIFACKFDIGLTYRPHLMPINTGVIFVHHQGYKGALKFFGNFLKFMQAQRVEFQTWYGSQLVMKEKIEITNEIAHAKRFFIGKMWGAKVLLVPAMHYNFTTEPGVMMDGFYPDKAILHFKEKKRVFMKPYYEKYIHCNRSAASRG